GHNITILSVLFLIDILIRHFKQSLIRILFTFKSFSNKVFNKYYLKSDKSPLYAIAIILYPKRCIRYIRANWEKKW
ncbi:uncharacterized protein K441DRAFT_559189, partial [Cenococcum geophilum 1.58]|uniref:uncharacterized protein n=1 Tax=Cenococcum geophilum 1.58 TaxID=794803 RepID=UPI0035900584